ncbi:MAG: hypothetical protein IJ559_06190 [Prevotella sp.]|nr:hypothetical protein [Prevotella sp.]
MKHFSCLLAVLLLTTINLKAGSLDDIRERLEQSSVSQVQEKVYMHTDNQCYFVGDTLWYKAYVVRADNLKPTDMSRILYVELLSPDGLLVERQNIIVAPEGHTCGQFVLQDSLYSGYYELRAYTRWMLNFGVTEHPYTTPETWQFYNRQMAADYYRLWDGLYSRVIPIYSKPETPGDYDARRMYQRPKTRLQKPLKEELFATFYPEGGHLVKGLPSRVAFELKNQLGEAVDLKGRLQQGDQLLADIQTTHLGRGVFTVTPGTQRLKATFTWRGQQYTFNLPKVEESGAVVSVSDGKATLQTSGLPADCQYGVSVLCRGVLKFFSAVSVAEGTPVTIPLPLDSLPVGVNDLTVFDSDGRILADRLFFVGGTAGTAITPVTPVSATATFEPYQQVSVTLQTPEPQTTFSVAVRDSRTDEPTYNDGNVMTDLLLSSELRGFVARPAYYFESDDQEHRQNLDLLMMVQGWRKYPWRELSDSTRRLRYSPEKTMTVSGAVYKMLGITDVEQDEILSWQKGMGMIGHSLTETEADEDGMGGGTEVTMDLGSIGSVNDDLGVNHGGLSHEVLVEAEVVMDDGVVAGRQMTRDGGRFLFQIPPFYGATYLNLKAYKEKDSLKKSMLSRKDATVFKEDAFADYYVKRDMPYPVFTHKYSYYENHAPEWEVTIDEDSLSELSMENDVHQLQNVNVKGRRRGRRSIDWNKPAYVRDAYDLYNDLTDYGLSYGKFDMRQFPLQVAKFLFGNMGRLGRQFNVDGRWNGLTYWRNYQDMAGVVEGMGIDGADALADALRSVDQRRSPATIMNNLKLARLQNIRVFTDYEPRNEDSTMVESLHLADATVDMENIPDDGTQVVYRDRHIFIHGFNEPAEFYQPDYSHRPVGSYPADYRRTLYWNPNARSDEEGRFTATFYNNSKETRIRISAAGVTTGGSLLFAR